MESDDFEEITGSKTSILKSPKKFIIGDAGTYGFSCPDLGNLEEIKACSENHYLTIVGKVLSVESPDMIKVNINKNLSLQIVLPPDGVKC